MQEQLISFETAKLAAEKGYDEDCDYIYDIHGNIIYRPLCFGYYS